MWNSHVGSAPQPRWKLCHSLKPGEKRGCKRNYWNISIGPPGPVERKTDQDLSLGNVAALSLVSWLTVHSSLHLPVLQFPFSLPHCLVDSASVLATIKLRFLNHLKTTCTAVVGNMTRTRLWWHWHCWVNQMIPHGHSTKGPTKNCMVQKSPGHPGIYI